MDFVVKKGNELDTLPNGAAYYSIVADVTTGKYYKAIISGSGGSSGITTIETDSDIQIDLTEGQVLEYISLKNADSMDLFFGFSPGGSELLAQTVADPQPLVLMHYAEANETIYITGILTGTTVKFKIS